MTMEFVAYKENLDSFAGRGYLPIGSSTTRVCNTAQLYLHYQVSLCNSIRPSRVLKSVTATLLSRRSRATTLL